MDVNGDANGTTGNMDTMKFIDGGQATTTNDFMEPILSYSSSAGDLLDINKLNGENQQHPTFTKLQPQSTSVPASIRPPVIETIDRGFSVLKNQEETRNETSLIDNIPRPNGGDCIALSRDVSVASSTTSTVPTVATTVVSDSTNGTNQLEVGTPFIPKSVNDLCYTEIAALKEGNSNVISSTLANVKMTSADMVQPRDPQQLVQMQPNAASQQTNRGHSTNHQYQHIIVPAIQLDRSTVSQDSPRPPLSRNPSNEQQLQALLNARAPQPQPPGPQNSSYLPQRSILMENTSTTIQPPSSPLMTPQFLPTQQHRSTSPAVPPPIPGTMSSHLTPSSNRHSNTPHNHLNHQLQQVIDVSVPQLQSSTTSEPQKRKSRFVVLGQNTVPANPSQNVEESQKHLPEHHKQEQNQHNGTRRHHNGLDIQPLSSSYQQTHEQHSGSRSQYVTTPINQPNSSSAFPDRPQLQTQYPVAPQYILVTGAPPGNTSGVDPAHSSTQYHIVGTQSMEQAVMIPKQVFVGHASTERHNRAMSEGVGDNITQVMYLQPVTSRHYRPRSEGVLDTSGMQHDQRQTIAQGVEFYQYSNSDQPNGLSRGTSRHQNQVDTVNLNQSNPSQVVSGDISPSLSINNGTASQLASGQNQQTVTNSTAQAQSSCLTLPPLNVQGRQTSAPTNVNITEASGSSQGTRNVNSESVKMTKGRFRVLDSGVVPPTHNSGSFEGHTEVSETSASGGNLLPGGVQATAGNSTIKKGRFVVLNVTEATPAFLPGQSSHTPAVFAIPHVSNTEPFPPVSSHVDQNVNNRVSSTNESQNSAASEAQKIDANISNRFHTRLPSSSDSPIVDEAHQMDKSGASLQSSQEKDAGTYKTKSVSSEATSNRVSASPVQKERNSTPVGAVVTRTTKMPIIGQHAGVGKLMYHLNMMQSEMNDVDRFHRNLQTENKCLKEKNKELEARARDWEKKFYSEKSLREKAEAKIKELKAKLKSSKDSFSVVDAEAGKIEETNSTSTSIGRGKISRTNSTDCDAELIDVINRSDGNKIDGTNLKITENDQLSLNQRSDTCRETDVVASPQTSKEIKKVMSSDSSQMSPTRDHSGRSIPIPKPPILPLLQKKPGMRGPVSSSSLQNPSKKIVESRQQSASSSTITGPQNVESNDIPAVSNQNSPISKASQGSILNGVASMDVQKSFDRHNYVATSSIPPKPQGVSVKSRSDNGGANGAFRVPGSSLTNSFDPLAPSGSHPGPPTDNQKEAYNQQLPPPLPGYVVTPIARDVSDLMSFPVDSWIHAPAFDSEPTFESAEFASNQQPMFLIHQPVNIPSWPAYQAMEASQIYSDVQHVPIMTYATQVYTHVNNPSVSDIDSSREHSRNPSSSQVQHVSQSVASSPSHQGSSNHPDLLSADEFSNLHTDGNPSDLLSETASLLQSNSQFAVEDVLTRYDPFDEIVQRKTHSDDF